MFISKRIPWWIRFQVWASIKLFGYTSSPRVFYVGKDKILKVRCHRAEAEAMEFVRKHTTIPIPAVLKMYGKGDYQDLILERVPGQDLQRVWRSLTAEQKTAIVEELAGYVSQLRQLVPPKEGVVGSVSLDAGGYDHRLGGRRFGPFSIVEFHKFVRRGIDLESWSTRDEIVARVHGRSDIYSTKFTHGDISPQNIMVANGKITAIIDWEFGGWFPEYWEYTKIYYCYLDWQKEFYTEVERTFTNYPEELDADQAIWEVYDSLDYDPSVHNADVPPQNPDSVAQI